MGMTVAVAVVVVVAAAAVSVSVSVYQSYFLLNKIKMINAIRWQPTYKANNISIFPWSVPKSENYESGSQVPSVMHYN